MPTSSNSHPSPKSATAARARSPVPPAAPLRAQPALCPAPLGTSEPRATRAPGPGPHSPARSSPPRPWLAARLRQVWAPGGRTRLPCLPRRETECELAGSPATPAAGGSAPRASEPPPRLRPRGSAPPPPRRPSAPPPHLPSPRALAQAGPRSPGVCRRRRWRGQSLLSPACAESRASPPCGGAQVSSASLGL